MTTKKTAAKKAEPTPAEPAPEAPAAVTAGLPAGDGAASGAGAASGTAPEAKDETPGPVEIPSTAGRLVPPAEVWDRWETAYARHAGTTPNWGKECRDVPPSLRTEPEFAELAEVRDGVRKLEGRLRRDRGAVRERNRERRERYRNALQDALFAGTERPAPPEDEPDPWDSGQRVDIGRGEGPQDYWADNMIQRLYRILGSVEIGRLHEGADRWRKVLEERSRPQRERVDKIRGELAEAEQALEPFTAATTHLDTITGQARLARSGGGHAGDGAQPDDLDDAQERAAVAVEQRGARPGTHASHMQDRAHQAAFDREMARAEAELGSGSSGRRSQRLRGRR